MSGLGHESAHVSEAENQQTVARNARYGVVLFTIYSLFYGVFMLLSAFWPALMDVVVLAGLNLAVLYGLILIVAAFLLALLYGWLCRHAAAPLHSLPPAQRGTTDRAGGRP